MIAHLKGILLSKHTDSLVLDVNGVGYEVIVSAHCMQSLGKEGEAASLVIYTDVRESAITLFGFGSVAERQVFLLLKKVKGIGSRLAQSILSSLDAVTLMKAIGNSDSSLLQKVPGIGKKSAERIIVELREQVLKSIDLASVGADTRSGPLRSNIDVVIRHSALTSTEAIDAALAMEQLGFSKDVSENAVVKALSDRPQNTETADILRLALQHIA